jgi:hypothetical protein
MSEIAASDDVWRGGWPFDAEDNAAVFLAHQLACIASMWGIYQEHLAKWRLLKERDDRAGDLESARQRYLWYRHAAWSRYSLRQALRGCPVGGHA